MAAQLREDLLAAGLAVFDRDGFEGATVAAIRARARRLQRQLLPLLRIEEGTGRHAVSGNRCSAITPRSWPRVEPGLSAQAGHRPADPRASRLGRRTPARGALSVRDLPQRMDRGTARRAARAEFAPCRRHRAMARAAGRARRIAADDAGAVLQPDHRAGADLLPRLSVGPRPRRSESAGGSPDRLRDPRGGRRSKPTTGDKQHDREKRSGFRADRNISFATMSAARDS